MMDCPVLLIVFNRLDTVKQVFEPIRSAQPKKLYVAADGPRKDREGEAERCAEVREWIMSHIDWDCEVKTRFLEENIGCGWGPSTAISWMFETEDRGIILEDDCVASPSFFSFAEQMLDKYKDDKNVSIICGSNFDDKHLFQAKDADYFFSKISYTWGWATWRRNWEDYDFGMRAWGSVNKARLLHWLFDEPEYLEYWRYIFNETYRHQPQDIWDYQFFFSCYRKRQMAIVPNVNLISNIGDGSDATHTQASVSKLGRSVEDLGSPLRHPHKMVRNLAYDIHLQETCYGRAPVPSLKTRVKGFLKKHLRSL